MCPHRKEVETSDEKHEEISKWSSSLFQKKSKGFWVATLRSFQLQSRSLFIQNWNFL